jgi:hypothetical protein
MSTVVKAKKIVDLPETTTIANTDLLVIEKVGANTTTTSKITGASFRAQMCRGPFVDDPTAANNGVNVGEMYYNASGVVKVRLI